MSSGTGKEPLTDRQKQGGKLKQPRKEHLGINSEEIDNVGDLISSGRSHSKGTPRVVSFEDSHNKEHAKVDSARAKSQSSLQPGKMSAPQENVIKLQVQSRE